MLHVLYFSSCFPIDSQKTKFYKISLIFNISLSLKIINFFYRWFQNYKNLSLVFSPACGMEASAATDGDTTQFRLLMTGGGVKAPARINLFGQAQSIISNIAFSRYF